VGTNNAIAVSEAPAKRSLAQEMGDKFGLEPQKLLETVKATVFPNGNATNEQLAAFLVVARQYDLNPFTRELYAFPGRGNGIVPIVSIDGWTSIINRQPDLDGIEFQDRMENGRLAAITCRMYRKSRTRPTEVTEYMAECARETEPWKKWPARMLRHKALIQCARYAFSLSGIFDEDEADRIESIKPSGKVELSADSPLNRPAGPGPELPEMYPGFHRAGLPAVSYRVEQDFTYINGNVVKIARELKKIQAIPEGRGWKMPAGLTHEFVALCERENIAIVEIQATQPAPPSAPQAEEILGDEPFYLDSQVPA
jgi:phage recombination protein Bet